MKIWTVAHSGALGSSATISSLQRQMGPKPMKLAGESRPWETKLML